MPSANHAHRAGSKKRIEDVVTRIAAREDTRLDERWRKGGEMSVAERLRVDRPDGAPVSFASPIITIFHHRLAVVEILLALRKKKQELMAASGPIFHAFRHGIGLVPDDVAAKKPPIGLQRESEPPRHPNQVLGF